MGVIDMDGRPIKIGDHVKGNYPTYIGSGRMYEEVEGIVIDKPYPLPAVAIRKHNGSICFVNLEYNRKLETFQAKWRSNDFDLGLKCVFEDTL